jgi:indole-3-glycerol phosphate synthase
MGFLTDVVAEVRAELANEPLDVGTLRLVADAAPDARSLAATLKGFAEEDGVAVIAEVKRASPAAGLIAGDVDPVAQAIAYQGSAAAISVITEPRHFAGSIDDLRNVRAAVQRPVLRKDFLVDPSQLVEARAAGADSVLLVTSCLERGELASMLAASRELGMEPLVETHSDDDLERALDTDAEVIGVNARDLETLEVDVAVALERLRRVPPDRVAVLESGIGSRADVVAAVRAGASAVLVGEALMRSKDPATLIDALLHGDDVAPREVSR